MKMQYSEIFKKVSEGETVHWSSQGYTVILKEGELYIVYDLGGRMEGVFSMVPKVFENTLFTPEQFY